MHEGKHGILDGLEDMDELFGADEHEHEEGHCGHHHDDEKKEK